MNTPSSTRDAVIHERATLDLDPVADGDTLIDEHAAADDAIDADPGTGPDVGPMPDRRTGTDRDVVFDVRGRMDAGRGMDHDLVGLLVVWREGRPEYTGRGGG